MQLFFSNERFYYIIRRLTGNNDNKCNFYNCRKHLLQSKHITLVLIQLLPCSHVNVKMWPLWCEALSTDVTGTMYTMIIEYFTHLSVLVCTRLIRGRSGVPLNMINLIWQVIPIHYPPAKKMMAYYWDLCVNNGDFCCNNALRIGVRDMCVKDWR